MAEWEMPSRFEAARTPPSSMTAARARKCTKPGNMVSVLDHFLDFLNQSSEEIPDTQDPAFTKVWASDKGQAMQWVY
ncbi:hypothetical protein [Hoeflea sp.]|uniref:hypothetical protein n=1 Tax=Hoeflea sp. TaxID=1940281 RepID=UPI00374863AF